MSPLHSPRTLLASLAVLSMALAVVAPGAVAAAPPAQDGNPAFEALVDRYLEEVQGVGADREPSDLSAESFAREIEVKRRVLADLQAIDRGTLSFDQDIDYRFLEGILRADIHWDENVERWRQDPGRYLPSRSSAVSRLISTDPRSPDARGRDVVAALELLQVRLANGKDNLTEYVERWVGHTLENLDGFLIQLDVDVPRFAERVSEPLRGELLAAAEEAAEAVRDFRRFLTEELPTRPAGDWRVGEEVFNFQHRVRYMFPEDDIHLRRIARGPEGFTRVPNYHDWGRKQFDIVRHHLEIKARRIDPERTWLEIIRDEKEDHFFNEQLVYKHHEAARATRDWVIDNDLVTIPWEEDDSIMEAAAPSAWAAQWWGFGPGVPRGGDILKSAWRIIPVNPDWPEHVAEENLSEKDASFMYAIATHEVYPGHHLQSLYNRINERRLRRYEGSYSNQSWCYYVEWELTPDPQYGWYPEDKQDVYELEALRLKLWRFGRVIIDSGLHTGRISYDEALNLESNEIGFVRRGARINVDGITQGGSRTAAPTLGYFQWMLLREDYFQKMRELDQKGTLKDFHDRIYRIGFLPVVLVREALFHQLEQEFGRQTD